MGVPKFYRWLSERYPLINQPVDENTLLPEVDNLYLDLNGTIHNATHGDGVSKRQTDRDVMLSVMAGIDAAVQLTRPRKLLYLAVDGVAPRAKMNQQRSRRFRAARDLAESHRAAVAKGEDIAAEEVFDSNCITPGTEFMDAVSAHLRYFIRRKMKEDPTWKQFKVIFSGHEVPGEGEHKIVSYIRAAKMQSDYCPTTRHCMAGLDADLVLLALATHEPHFTLLRDQVDFTAFRANKMGTKTATRATQQKKVQLLHIGLLREYLEVDMKPVVDGEDRHTQAESEGDFVYDGERVIDDFVLMAALCGNDFLPHLPSLDIGEGAIDTLLRVYRENLPRWGGYLTEGGLIHMARLESLLRILGAMEVEIFKARAVEAARFAAKQKRARRRVGDPVLGLAAGVGTAGEEPDGDGSDAEASDAEVAEEDITPGDRAAAEEAILAATAARLALETNQVSGGITDDVVVDEHGHEVRPPPSPFALPRNGRKTPTAIGFKERYYNEKFGIAYGMGSNTDNAILQQLKQSYIEALQWVMLYYYRGCPSWGWFFPFHYAPMTSDLVDLPSLNVSFKLGRPFLPFQQLLGCLPAASADFLPLPYRKLMTEEWSPLKDFYPPVADIKIDMNGKRNPWEGITLIPFIKEAEMLAAIDKHASDGTLTPEERKRNSFGEELLFEYDETAVETVPSSLPGVFPSVSMCNTRMSVFSMPAVPVLTSGDAAAVRRAPASTIDRDAVIRVDEAGMAGASSFYSARPRPGCVVPAPGYPTLHTLPFSPMLSAVSMNVFGLKSKKDSLILGIGEGRKDPDLVEEEEGDAMLALAGSAFGSPQRDAYRSPALDPLAGTHVQPLKLASDSADWPAVDEHARDGWLPAHRPVFSIEYAPGTSVHDGASHCDIWSVLGVPEPHEDHAHVTTARLLAKRLLGRVVYVEWPHLREGIVVGVSDASDDATWHGDEDHVSMVATTAFHSRDYTAKDTEIKIKPHSAEEAVKWIRDASQLKISLLSGKEALGTAGVNVGKPLLVLTVRKLIGMRRDPETGALRRVWAQPGSSCEIKALSELVLQKNPAVDPRFEPHAALSPCDRFPVASKVMVLDGVGRGCVGHVQACDAATGLLDVQVDVLAAEPPFGHNICGAIKDTFIDSKRAADSLGITTTTLGKVTGSVILQPGRFDIGLNLKVNRNIGPNKGQVQLFLPGYVRSVAAQASASNVWASGVSGVVSAAKATGGGGWEYTERAIQLVAAYQRAFPLVFALIESAPSEPYYNIKSIPGKGEMVEKIGTYLQQLDTYKRALVPVSTQFMAPTAIAAVEKAADTLNARRGAPTPMLMRGVHCSQVYRQEVNAYAVGAVGEGEGSALSSSNVDGPSCIPILGDRVANLSFRNAPLGARGTVVAIHGASAFVEVLFDAEFVGGSTLGGLCSNGRGALVPWSALLCLSRSKEAGVAAKSEVATPEIPDAMPRGKRGNTGKSAGGAPYTLQTRADKSPATPTPAPAPAPHKVAPASAAKQGSNAKPAAVSAALPSTGAAKSVSLDALFASAKQTPAATAPAAIPPSVAPSSTDVSQYWKNLIAGAGVDSSAVDTGSSVPPAIVSPSAVITSTPAAPPVPVVLEASSPTPAGAAITSADGAKKASNLLLPSQLMRKPAPK